MDRIECMIEEMESTEHFNGFLVSGSNSWGKPQQQGRSKEWSLEHRTPEIKRDNEAHCQSETLR
jgi:hypothetical protein